ncbi:MAG: hypothetical protein OXQ90_05290 [Gammaproteobacteria bacterium]|nr:hypothetical protein [Gammaproteobacteria bacterium]
MTTLQRLQLEQSEKRQRINELLGLGDQITDDQRTELDGLTKRMGNLEIELRAAIVAQPDPVETRTDSPEGRERRSLIGKCLLENYLAAYVGNRPLVGAEQELATELGMVGDIPSVIFTREVPAGELETRAATPAPGTVGVNMQAVEQIVFASNLAMRLGIEIRDVPSGTAAIPTITTAPSTAAPKAKDGAADATAGAITVQSATPKRIPAKLTVRIEDIAAFGNGTFEPALRTALQNQLEHSFDSQIITGNGTSPNLNGLINQLTAPTAQGAELTWPTGIGVVNAFIDGTWAYSCMDLAVCVNPEGYRKAAGTFQAPETSGANGEYSLASYLDDKCDSFFTNSRMPATASSGALNKNATLIVARKGHDSMSRAVVPHWGRFSVDDIYTDSAKGQRNFVVSAITGDLMLVQSSAYQLGAWQVQA